MISRTEQQQRDVLQQRARRHEVEGGGDAKEMDEEEIDTAQVASLLNPRRGPKSRNGCLRCKAKRLKCDERKPECYQCNRKRIVCPGYKSPGFVWSTKHEKTLPLDGSPAPLPPESLTLARQLQRKVEREGLAAAGKSDSREGIEKDVEDGVGITPTENPMDMSRELLPKPHNSSFMRRPNISPTTDSLSAIRQQLHQSTVPDFLLHLPTMLVEYYFNYVCQIFSSFDGTLNPFRSTVGRLWDGSAPIYYAIQSMAAAYLANHFPRMSPVGKQMQRETYKCLYQAIQPTKDSVESLDRMLLTVLLVGQTTAWHSPRDLGLVHLKTAKRLHRRRLQQQTRNVVDSRGRRQNEFFEQCILYWDMLAGFVDDSVEDFGVGDGDSVSVLGSADTDQVFPHPWTGVSPKVQRLFASVGRLIRRYRASLVPDTSSLDFLSLDAELNLSFDPASFNVLETTAKAETLEGELLAVELPSVSSLVDAGDENTPVQQYLYLAEAYRCAALLEIYRIWPSLLLKHGSPSPLDEFGLSPSPSLISTSQDASSVSRLPIPFFPAQPTGDYLISLAIHTLGVLELLPSTSGTRCLQPIVLIAAASELRFTPIPNSFSFPLFGSDSFSDPHIVSTPQQQQTSHAQPPPPPPLSSSPMPPFLPADPADPAQPPLFSHLTTRELDVASARRFVIGRLQEFQLSLPAKPMITAMELVREVWARGDGGEDVFWMDVMEQQRFQSIFG